MGISWVFMGFSRLFPGCLKAVTKLFQACFMCVSRGHKRHFKGVSKVQESVKGFKGIYQVCIKPRLITLDLSLAFVKMQLFE